MSYNPKLINYQNTLITQKVEKITPDGTTNYDYGTLGELKSVTSPTKSISYQHNASNQRVAKKVDGIVVEKYLWANLTTLLAIYDKDDNLIQRFEYADSRMPIAMTQDNQKYYLHYDQVGTLKAISDSSGNIVKEVVYDTFGNILSDSNPSFKVPFGFAGGLYDSDTKLTRFGYCDYDAYTGKWTAKDPIGFAGGDSNLYGYVLGDPVGGIDPLGLFDMDCYAKCIETRRWDLWKYTFPIATLPKRVLPPFKVPKKSQPWTNITSDITHWINRTWWFFGGQGKLRLPRDLVRKLPTNIKQVASGLIIVDGIHDWYLLGDCALECKDKNCE